jgi:hypothetical protein
MRRRRPAASTSRRRTCFGPCTTTSFRRRICNAPRRRVRRMRRCGLDWPTTILPLGDTARAQAELARSALLRTVRAGLSVSAGQGQCLRQEHHDAQALTSFAQAANAEGEDQTAEEALLQAGADEGLRVTPIVSVLSDFSVNRSSKIRRCMFWTPSSMRHFQCRVQRHFAALPPPRSSLETQWTDAYHLHLESSAHCQRVLSGTQRPRTNIGAQPRIQLLTAIRPITHST